MSGRWWDRVGEFRNELRWTVVVLVLAGLAIFALWPRGSEQATEPGALPGQPVPVRTADPAQRAEARLLPCSVPQDAARPGGLSGVTGTCLADGSRVDLAAAVGGRTTLINVWATWCGPCRTELPALQAYSEQPDAARVLGVQVQSDEASGLDLLRELGVHFPNVYDADNRIQAALRAPNVLPMSFVVTSGGEVRRIDPPVAFRSADEVRSAVQRTVGATK